MSTSHVVCTRLKSLSSEKLKVNVNSWDSAIQKAKLRIVELKLSIKVFKQQKKAGEKWPGEKA